MGQKKTEILKYNEITPSYINEVFEHSSISARVQSFEIETVGTGQLGETRRFKLSYESGAVAAPSSLVGKFPSDDQTAANTGKDLGFYRAEVMFYQHLAPRTEIFTPRVYVAEIDNENNFILLLEDLAPAVQGDHMVGCDVEEAKRAINEAALLHSAFWNDKALESQPWLYIPDAAQGFYTTELVESSWEYFRKTYESKMDPAVIQLCEKFVLKHEQWNQPRKINRCFSHNDFRVDNMLFGGERIAVVDWQTSNYLGAGMDVSYFLGSAFSRKTRQSVEMDLLKEYHSLLLSGGVEHYSFEELLIDYRHYSFAVLVVAIAATVIVKKTERGDRLFMKMVSDGAYQAIDNEAADLL